MIGHDVWEDMANCIAPVVICGRRNSIEYVKPAQGKWLKIVYIWVESTENRGILLNHPEQTFLQKEQMRKTLGIWRVSPEGKPVYCGALLCILPIAVRPQAAGEYNIRILITWINCHFFPPFLPVPSLAPRRRLGLSSWCFRYGCPFNGKSPAVSAREKIRQDAQSARNGWRWFNLFLNPEFAAN